MPRNTLMDLNNHLFAELERLGDEDLSQEELEKEISKSVIQLSELQVKRNSLHKRIKEESKE